MSSLVGQPPYKPHPHKLTLIMLRLSTVPLFNAIRLEYIQLLLLNIRSYMCKELAPISSPLHLPGFLYSSNCCSFFTDPSIFVLFIFPPSSFYFFLCQSRLLPASNVIPIPTHAITFTSSSAITHSLLTFNLSPPIPPPVPPHHPSNHFLPHHPSELVASPLLKCIKKESVFTPLPPVRQWSISVASTLKMAVWRCP